MRPSKRTNILQAAVRVAESHGVTGVTLDSVAKEAELTKGGLMWHFPTKEALLLGVQQYLADQWEEAMVAAAGKTAAQATPQERVAAYARVATTSATSAEMALILDFAQHLPGGTAWVEVAQRWTPSPQEAATDDQAFEMFLARLAADGLWAFESILQTKLDDDLRHALAERIAAMIQPTVPALDS